MEWKNGEQIGLYKDLKERKGEKEKTLIMKDNVSSLVLF
jgi:hypothetical protein